MRWRFCLVLSAAMLLSGCLLLGGKEEAPGYSNAASGAEQVNDANMLRRNGCEFRLPASGLFSTASIPGESSIEIAFELPEEAVKGWFERIRPDFPVDLQKVAEAYAKELIRKGGRTRIEEFEHGGLEGYLVEYNDPVRDRWAVAGIVPVEGGCDILHTEGRGAPGEAGRSASSILAGFGYTEVPGDLRSRGQFLFASLDPVWRWVSDTEDGVVLAAVNGSGELYLHIESMPEMPVASDGEGSTGGELIVNNRPTRVVVLDGSRTAISIGRRSYRVSLFDSRGEVQSPSDWLDSDAVRRLFRDLLVLPED